MTNIENAMKIEEAYVQHRLNNEEPFALVDEIKKCGFNSLSDYFNEKTIYLLSSLDFNLVIQPMPEGVAEIFKMIESNRSGILLVDWEDTFVVSGSDGLETFNEEFCRENNIQFFPLHTGGGTIVGTKGDISIGICVPSSLFTNADFILNKIKDILQKSTQEKVSVDKNDILIDGNKICGSAVYRSRDIIMIIMHFSFSDKHELISKICTTNKTGKPIGFISSMTREEFKKEVSEWLLLY